MGLKNHFLSPSPLLGGGRGRRAPPGPEIGSGFFSPFRENGVGGCVGCGGVGSVGQRSGVRGMVFFVENRERGGRSGLAQC